MTVAELIEELNCFAGNLTVVISEDGAAALSIYDRDDDGQVGEIAIPPDHL